MAVLLTGPRSSPEVLGRTELSLCDPAVPASAQPYHATFGTLETNEKRLASRIALVRRAAECSVTSALREWFELGVDLVAASLVVGSLRPPEAIANEHIRAHALEGQLFRTVLAEALASHGVRSAFILERNVYAEASTTLSRSPDDLKAAISAMGRSVGKPWRADHKLAAMAAWLQLA